jgi:N utilization substance protein B
MTAVKVKQPNDNSGKRLARLAAVQALYQSAQTQRSAKEIIRDFQLHPPELLSEGDTTDSSTRMDRDLFNQLVTGVMTHVDDLDIMLSGAIDDKFSIARMEILLRSILRAGAFELHHHTATASGIIVNDYIDIAHAFFNDKEPGLVNAVLDRLAKKLRS